MKAKGCSRLLLANTKQDTSSTSGSNQIKIENSKATPVDIKINFLQKLQTQQPRLLNRSNLKFLGYELLL